MDSHKIYFVVVLLICIFVKGFNGGRAKRLSDNIRSSLEVGFNGSRVTRPRSKRLSDNIRSSLEVGIKEFSEDQPMRLSDSELPPSSNDGKSSNDDKKTLGNIRIIEPKKKSETDTSSTTSGIKEFSEDQPMRLSDSELPPKKRASIRNCE